MTGIVLVTPLPNDKSLDCSKFKAFAGDKMNVTQKLSFGQKRAEKNMGKWEIAGTNVFKRLLSEGLCWKWVNL